MDQFTSLREGRGRHKDRMKEKREAVGLIEKKGMGGR